MFALCSLVANFSACQSRQSQPPLAWVRLISAAVRLEPAAAVVAVFCAFAGWAAGARVFLAVGLVALAGVAGTAAAVGGGVEAAAGGRPDGERKNPADTVLSWNIRSLLLDA